MATVLGLNCKLKIGTAGSTATTEMTNVKDVTLNIETGEADVTTRAAKGWRQNVATLKEASLEFQMLYDPEDTENFQKVQDAFFGGKAVSFLVSDDGGTLGLDADFSITAFNIEQPLEEAATVSVTAKPTTSTRAPKWTGASEAA